MTIHNAGAIQSESVPRGNRPAERLLEVIGDNSFAAEALKAALRAERLAVVEELRGVVRAKRAMYFSQTQTDSARTLDNILRHLDNLILDEVGVAGLTEERQR